MSALYVDYYTRLLLELYLLNYSGLSTDACSTTCSTTWLLLAKLLFSPPLLLLAVSEGEDGVRGEMRERGEEKLRERDEEDDGQPGSLLFFYSKILSCLHPRRNGLVPI